MINISATNGPLFYAIFFLLIAGGMMWILRNFIKGVHRIALPFVLPAPLVWQSHAWSDLGWKGGIHYYRVGLRRTEAAGVISRLTPPATPPKRPLRVTLGALKATLAEAAGAPGWLTYSFDAQGLLAPLHSLKVCSSQHGVELAIQRTPLAALSTLAVRQRGVTNALIIGPGRDFAATISLDAQPFGRFVRHAQSVHLVDDRETTLGIWSLALQPHDKFGPDTPHFYGSLTVAGNSLAELIRPGNTTQARFQKEPFAPMVRHVRPKLTVQEEKILFAFVALQIYCLISGYYFGT